MVNPFSCPIHREQRLVTLFYHEMRLKNGKKQGATVKSNWLWCKICKKPLQVTIDQMLQFAKVRTH